MIMPREEGFVDRFAILMDTYDIIIKLLGIILYVYTHSQRNESVELRPLSKKVHNFSFTFFFKIWEICGMCIFYFICLLCGN